MANKKDITNADVRDALITLGFLQPGADIDLGGAQNGFFKNGLMTNLGITQEQFDAAKTLGRWDGDPDTQGDVMGALTKVGVNLATTVDANQMFQRFQNVQSGKMPDGTAIGTVTAPPAGAAPPAQDLQAGPAGTRVAQLGQLPTPPKPKAAPAPAPPTQLAAAAPATTPTPGAGAKAAPTDWAGKPIPKTPQELDDYIKANYGFAAMATSDPDIAKILHDSAVGGWSPDKTKGLISTTTWWKNHTDADRQWIDLEKTDPATAKKRQSMQLTDLQNIVSKSGETIDPRRLELISNLSLRHGWSTGETAAALAAEYRYDPTGKVTGISADLKSQARNYATTLSDASFTQWGKQILAGTATMDTFKDYLSTQAKLLLPGMAAQIDQGFDVKTLVDPYMQRAAKLLDLDPNTMDFTDPKWLRFINARDAKGNVQPVNYADMEATIKTDPQYGWDKTKGAHEEAAQMSSTILSKFGMG